jgi:hypothetical protein
VGGASFPCFCEHTNIEDMTEILKLKTLRMLRTAPFRKCQFTSVPLSPELRKRIRADHTQASSMAFIGPLPSFVEYYSGGALVCKVCRCIFSRLRIKHLGSEVHHSRMAQYEQWKCEPCGFQGRSEVGFQTHCELAKHTKRTQPPPNLKCEPCGTRCRTSTEYTTHILTKKHLRRCPPATA